MQPTVSQTTLTQQSSVIDHERRFRRRQRAAVTFRLRLQPVDVTSKWTPSQSLVRTSMKFGGDACLGSADNNGFE